MKTFLYFLLAFNMICLWSSCMNNEIRVNQNLVSFTECPLDSINAQISRLSIDINILDTVFYLQEEEQTQYQYQSYTEDVYENIMLRFMARLNDENVLTTLCDSTSSFSLKVGDLAFYCLARVEKFPFALATGRQNYTEPFISSQIWIPTDFIHHTSYKRERLTFHFLKYYSSKERQDFLKKIANDEF